ncbi:MAG TPA: helix-turn-helix domain-containing protein [Solirubrobacterales bacterium]|nr:helix-turn-helix domain-containing protein [Solirubrobacterales bacterium]
MDLPPSGEGALAEPKRAQIFAFLVERRGPAGTDEVAAHFGLHPNGVRRHLERLLEGGFVTRGRVRMAKGRPRDSWAVAPDAHPGGMQPRAYTDLAKWLARAIPSSATRLRELERTGKEIGRELAPAPGQDTAEDLRDALAALGFEPTLERGEGGSFTCSLGNCPYKDSVRESAEVVCTLHRGITAGLLAELDPQAKLTGFVPKDPERAGCLVEVDSA